MKTKRNALIFAVFLAFFLIVLVGSLFFTHRVTEIASGTCDDNLIWTLDSNGTLTISGSGEICDNPWKDNYEDQIISVVIEDNVTGIEDYAFSNCPGLDNINIGSSVASIEDYVFFDCTNLTNITVSSDNAVYSSIDGILFDKDQKELIAYPAGKTETSYDIPNGVTNIKERAFFNCINLRNITISDSVTDIEYGAFWKCTNLNSINIPDSIPDLKYNVFCGCTSLTSIDIPDSVANIESSAFESCSSLANVSIGNNVTSIGYSAFRNCSSLTSIDIPDSVTNIDSFAFSDCTALTSINIGNSTDSIDDSAFNGCISLAEISVSSDNVVYSSIDGVLFDKEQEVLKNRRNI